MSRSLFFTVIGCALAAAQSTAPERLNRVIALHEAKTPALGVFAANISTRSGAAISNSPLDFVIIDLEHSPYDPTRLESYLLAMVDKRRIFEKRTLQPAVVPIVRLPSNGREHVEYMIKQVLDLGAFGVVVPHVNNQGDALAAVRAMRYAHPDGLPDSQPAGRRGVGYGWAVRYWGLSALEYVKRADLWPLDPQGELLLWCMVESAEGVANVREIATTPGVSGLFLGPSDLAVSLGVSESDEEVEQAIEKVAAVCRQTAIPCGTLTSGEGVTKRLRQGFRFLAVGGDAGVSSSVERSLRLGREFK